MNRSTGLGIGVLAGLAGLALLSKPRRDRIGALLSARMGRRMEHLMASLPDNSPPKLVMSMLPRMHAQNEQILEMLREQNALLREHLKERPGVGGGVGSEGAAPLP